VIELLRVEVRVSVASFEVWRSSRKTVGPCANTVNRDTHATTGIDSQLAIPYPVPWRPHTAALSADTHGTSDER
jgi:hypothetical protein